MHYKPLHSFLYLQLSELADSEKTLKADLAREREEKAALKRKQNALDRELARLMAQQKKLTQQIAAEQQQRRESLLGQSLSGSKSSLENGGAEKVIQKVRHYIKWMAVFTLKCFIGKPLTT